MKRNRSKKSNTDHETNKKKCSKKSNSDLETKQREGNKKSVSNLETKRRVISRKRNSNLESQDKKRSKICNSNLKSQPSEEEASVASCSTDTFLAYSVKDNEFIDCKLRKIMHIKGDVMEPRDDSVHQMKSLLRKEMNTLLEHAEQVASIKKSRVISYEHILLLVTKNEMKLKRLLRYVENMDNHRMHTTALSNTNDDSIPSECGKKLKMCFEFLQELGGFKEFISTFHTNTDMDPALRIRLERRDLLQKYMTSQEYVKYTEESCQATFCPKQQIVTFKDWLLKPHFTYLTVNPLAVRMIEFLALETVSVIIDAAIQIQIKRLGIERLFSHVAEPDFNFAVPEAIEESVDERKQLSDLPSTSGNKNVCSKSSYVSWRDKEILSTHSASSRRNSFSSNDSDSDSNTDDDPITAYDDSDSEKDYEFDNDELTRDFFARISDDNFNCLDDEEIFEFNEIMKGTEPFYTKEELEKLSASRITHAKISSLKKQDFGNSSRDCLSPPNTAVKISETPIAISPVTGVKKRKKPGTTKIDKRYKTCLKTDAVTSGLSDSNKVSCDEGCIIGSHKSLPSSTSPERISSDNLATSEPSDYDLVSQFNEVLKSFQQPYSEEELRGTELKENAGSLKKDARSLNEDIVIRPMAGDCIPSYLRNNINNSCNSFSSPIRSEETRIFLNRPALAPEEITDAYIDLQATNVSPICSWFQEEKYFETIPKLVCLA